MSALFDPFLECVDFGLVECATFFGWWHAVGGIVRGDEFYDFAVFDIAGDNGKEAIAVFGGAFVGIEPKVGFACFGVGAVASEAVGTEDWSDVAIEVYFLLFIGIGICGVVVGSMKYGKSTC